MHKHSESLRTRELRAESARMVGAADAVFNGTAMPRCECRTSGVFLRATLKTMTTETNYAMERTGLLFDYGAP